MLLLATGQYMTDKLVNVGGNRWALKPEFAAMIPLPWKLLLEVETGAWFFAQDKNFLMGGRNPFFQLNFTWQNGLNPDYGHHLNLFFFGADSKKLEKPSW